MMPSTKTYTTWPQRLARAG